MLRRNVLAIRIYLSSGGVPMADLYIEDGVVETIEWTNKRQRKEFESAINGYTLIYDERPKKSWAEWINR